MTPEESKDFVAQFLAKRAEMSEEMRKKCAIDAEKQLRDAAEEHFRCAWSEMLGDVTKRVMADIATDIARGIQLACAPQQQPFMFRPSAENKACAEIKDWLTVEITADATTVTTTLNALRQRTDSLASPMTSPRSAQEIAEIKEFAAKMHEGEMLYHFGEHPRRMSILGGEIEPTLIREPLNKRDITLIHRCLRKMKRDACKARQKRMRSHTKQVKWVCR